MRIRISRSGTFEPFVGRGVAPPSPDAFRDDEADVGVENSANEGRFELFAGRGSVGCRLAEGEHTYG